MYNIQHVFNLHIDLTHFTVIICCFITLDSHVSITGVYTYCDYMCNHVRSQYYDSYLHVERLKSLFKSTKLLTVIPTIRQAKGR